MKLLINFGSTKLISRSLHKNDSNNFSMANRRDIVYQQALEKCRQASEIMKQLTEHTSAKNSENPLFKKYNSTQPEWIWKFIVPNQTLFSKSDFEEAKGPLKDKCKKNNICGRTHEDNQFYYDKEKEPVSDDPCHCPQVCQKGNSGKKNDPCKKKEEPKKKEDPCKKKEEPKKKEDPCKKKEDPCKKKEDPCKKKEDPCKKKEDPCKKKEDPCKKKCSSVKSCPQLSKPKSSDIFEKVDILDKERLSQAEQQMGNDYKNLQYHAYTKTAFYDIHTMLTPERQEQPSAKKTKK